MSWLHRECNEEMRFLHETAAHLRGWLKEKDDAIHCLIRELSSRKDKYNKEISQKDKELKKAFKHMRRRMEVISLLEEKVKELGGDPLFYMTDEERAERQKAKEWLQSLNLFINE